MNSRGRVRGLVASLKIECIVASPLLFLSFISNPLDFPLLHLTRIKIPGKRPSASRPSALVLNISLQYDQGGRHVQSPVDLPLSEHTSALYNQQLTSCLNYPRSGGSLPNPPAQCYPERVLSDTERHSQTDDRLLFSLSPLR